MATSILQAERRRPSQDAQSRESVEAWLRRDLAERYGRVAEETLPDWLTRLLPAE